MQTQCHGRFTSSGTGETCCTTFWIKFSQRFQLLHPSNETYSAAIENAVYNALLRQMVFRNPGRGQPSGPRPTLNVSRGTPAQRLAAAQSQADADADPTLPPGIRYHATMEGVQEHGNVANTCCEGQGTRAIGSLPEYIFSISNGKRTSAPASASDGFYVNMFSQATLTFTASVAAGAGTVPPPPPPRPIPPVPPSPPAPPPITYDAIATAGYYRGALIGPVPTATSLDQCQVACTASEHPNMCMGLTWAGASPPPPPPPPGDKPCTSNCTLVAMPPGRFHQGTYSETGAAGVQYLADCKSHCLSDAACVQLTWVPRPADPCVLYSRIEASYWAPMPMVQGFVKCTAGATDPSCAPISPPAPPPAPRPAAGCVHYRAIDMSIAPTADAGVEQYMVSGRRVTVQHDWVAASSDEEDTANFAVVTASAVAVDNGTVDVQFALETEYPYGNGVEMSVTWLNPRVKTVAMTANIRMPSWLERPLQVDVNGHPGPIGNPGSFLVLDRVWSKGDTVSFSLPTVLTLTQYTGVDQIKGYEGRRYALKAGPVVLTCVGKLDSLSTIVLPVAAAAPKTWLVPVAGKSLQYTVKGAPGIVFKPGWEMLAAESFTTFPVFAGNKSSTA